MTTGERIRARRKELGISADMLAEKIGLSRSTMFRYENGYIEKMPMNNLIPIADALQTTVDYLMGWDVVNTEKAPTTDNGNERLGEFMELFAKLTEEQQTLIISQIKGILSNQ